MAYRSPAEIVQEWPDAIALVPLNPVVEGHLLVVPREHVKDFSTDPRVTGIAFRRAAELASWLVGDLNLITSRGRTATQSVFHLHVHVVPRKRNDGLALPWYSGKEQACECGHSRLVHTVPEPRSCFVRSSWPDACQCRGFKAKRHPGLA